MNIQINSNHELNSFEDQEKNNTDGKRLVFLT